MPLCVGEGPVEADDVVFVVLGVERVVGVPDTAMQ